MPVRRLNVPVPLLCVVLPDRLRTAGLGLLACCLFYVAGCGGGPGSSGSGSSNPHVVISGASQARIGGTTQFTATVTGTTDTSVLWQVNGVTGGASATGSISTTGLYTPPSSIPSPNTVTISVVTLAAPTATASLAETILNPLPVVSAATALPLGTNYVIDATGTGFVSGSQLQVAVANVTTTFVSATELSGTVTVPSGVSSVAVAVTNPNPGGTTSTAVNAPVQPPKATLTAAARLLDQATFGPTLAGIEHVQSVGLDTYITEQFNVQTTKLPDIPTNPLPTVCLNANNAAVCAESEWWQAAITAPDQLRQRVALALSEIFVISTDTDSGQAITPYHNMLANDAFTNYATVMKDVTLSPGMGVYLNMVNSAKPSNPAQIANENYARELMQLFSTGLELLNQDGTPLLDSNGNPQPVYTQPQVQAFARAYTGWTFANTSGSPVTKFPNNVYYFAPMASYENAHDTTAKTLLNGTILPAGQSAEQDLDGALVNIFNHPNVAPFVCRQLIQHLVASNPSPAYVGRVAAVFNDNGSGVRGDMKAVIRAILEDPDARAGDTSPSFDGGHLREPMLWITNLVRGLGTVNTDSNSSYFSLSNYSNTLGERPYRSPSVFNFFPPGYVIPGTAANAPEFGLENTASAILRLSLADSFVANKIGGFKTDLSATSTLGKLASNPGNLVDTLGMIFLHGQMPSAMRTAIVNEVSTLADPAQRARVATYLVVTSSIYKVEH